MKAGFCPLFYYGFIIDIAFPHPWFCNTILAICWLVVYLCLIPAKLTVQRPDKHRSKTFKILDHYVPGSQTVKISATCVYLMVKELYTLYCHSFITEGPVPNVLSLFGQVHKPLLSGQEKPKTQLKSFLVVWHMQPS